jgi:DNA-3-methyladenine glycosylase
MALILDREFYRQEATIVARALLGAVLVRRLADWGGVRLSVRLSGRIVETEAYRTPGDLASHGRHHRTPRNELMWESPGFAYVYLIYGMYWLFNVVCEPVDQPAAVLIRAVEPLEGETIMAEHRAGQPRRLWTNGPGRLGRALAITGAQHGIDLTTPAGGVWIEAGDLVPEDAVSVGPRVGLGKLISEPWLSMPWRWWITDSPFVSR